MRWPRSIWVVDLLLAVVVTVVAQVELVALTATDGVPLAWFLGNLLILPALALRRLRPLLATGLAAVGFALQLFTGALPVAVPFLALLVLLASLGWHASLRHGLLGTGLVLLGGLVPEVSRGTNPGDLLVNTVIITGTWLAAHLLRRASDRRVEAQVAADRVAREAVVAERQRIARDLHDSMAHALTLITLQAGSARERSTDPPTAELLGGIESTGREALEDLHRLLRLDGRGEDEALGVAALPDLVAEARRHDLEVDLEVDLAEALPSTLSTTVYRVVQESLTNVVRHSDARVARVGVSRDGAGTVVVRVDDDGAARPSRVTGTGRGLTGLVERVALLGGVVEAGPGASAVAGPGVSPGVGNEHAGNRRAGWRVEARIPWSGA